MILYTYRKMAKNDMLAIQTSSLQPQPL